MDDINDTIQEQIDAMREIPDDSDCEPGTYHLGVAFSHSCGARVVIGRPQAVMAALGNAPLKLRCECGEWLYLTPGQRIEKTRPQQGQTRRTRGGLVLP